MLAEILCCLHSLKGVWEMGRGVYIWLEIRTVFPMPLSYSCSARLKGPWCTPFLGWTRACPPQSLSPKMSAMRRDDTGATHTIWAAPLLNTFMLCLESSDKLTWIQDGSKHVLNLRHGVSEDGSEVADIGLCFALIWGLNNCNVSHKAAGSYTTRISGRLWKTEGLYPMIDLTFQDISLSQHASRTCRCTSSLFWFNSSWQGTWISSSVAVLQLKGANG